MREFFCRVSERLATASLSRLACAVSGKQLRGEGACFLRRYLCDVFAFLQLFTVGGKILSNFQHHKQNFDRSLIVEGIIFTGRLVEALERFLDEGP